MAITVVLVIVSVILIKYNTEGNHSVRYAAFIAVCEVKSAGFFNALSKTFDWLSAIAGLACMGIYCFNVININAGKQKIGLHQRKLLATIIFGLIAVSYLCSIFDAVVVYYVPAVVPFFVLISVTYIALIFHIHLKNKKERARRVGLTLVVLAVEYVALMVISFILNLGFADRKMHLNAFCAIAYLLYAVAFCMLSLRFLKIDLDAWGIDALNHLPWYISYFSIFIASLLIALNDFSLLGLLGTFVVPSAFLYLYPVLSKPHTVWKEKIVARRKEREEQSELDTADEEFEFEPAEVEETQLMANGYAISPEGKVKQSAGKLSDYNLIPQEAQVLCPKCGIPVNSENKFCTRCGTPLNPLEAEDYTSSNLSGDSTLNQEEQDMADGVIYSLTGARGRSIKVYEDRVEIKVNVTIGSLLTHNATDGAKTIYYSDVIGVQYKKCRVTLGYLQLETASVQMNNLNSNFFGENTFTFDMDIQAEMDEVAEYVQKRVNYYKKARNTPQTVIQTKSSADELLKFKELLDNGVISREEFEAKKRQILGM